MVHGQLYFSLHVSVVNAFFPVKVVWVPDWTIVSTMVHGQLYYIIIIQGGF